MLEDHRYQLCFLVQNLGKKNHSPELRFVLSHFSPRKSGCSNSELHWHVCASDTLKMVGEKKAVNEGARFFNLFSLYVVMSMHPKVWIRRTLSKRTERFFYIADFDKISSVTVFRNLRSAIATNTALSGEGVLNQYYSRFDKRDPDSKAVPAAFLTGVYRDQPFLCGSEQIQYIGQHVTSKTTGRSAKWLIGSNFAASHDKRADNNDYFSINSSRFLDAKDIFICEYNRFCDEFNVDSKMGPKEGIELSESHLRRITLDPQNAKDKNRLHGIIYHLSNYPEKNYDPKKALQLGELLDSIINKPSSSSAEDKVKSPSAAPLDAENGKNKQTETTTASPGKSEAGSNASVHPQWETIVKLSYYGKNKQTKHEDKGTDDVGDLKELRKRYVRPDWQDSCPSNVLEENDERRAALSEMKGFIKRIGGIGHKDNGGNQCIILADAGMGKTSFLRMLYFKIKKERIYPWVGRRECRLLTLGESSVEDISNISHKEKTILLLDSLDEDPLSQGRIPDRLFELLYLSRRFSRVVLTCRTQFIPENMLKVTPLHLRLQNFKCRVKYLSYFDDRQVRYFLRKQGCRTFFFFTEKSALSRALDMHDLRARPLLLSFTAFRPESRGRGTTKNKPETQYDIYERTISDWIDGYEAGKQTKLSEIGEIMKGVEEYNAEKVLQVCQHLAERIPLTEPNMISSDELGALMAELPGVGYLPDMVIEGRSLLNRTESGFTFAHRSIQEFLLVRRTAFDKNWQPDSSIKATFLMARFAAEMLVYADIDKRSVWEKLWALNIEQVLSEFLKTVTVHQRVALFNEIADIDARHGVGVTANGIPDISWIKLSPEVEISEYPVTVAQYNAYLNMAKAASVDSEEGMTQPDAEADTSSQQTSEEIANHPKVNVTWHEAQEFCNWLQRRHDQEYEIGLPSEAEWMVACGGRDAGKFPWGNDSDTENHCNCAQTSIHTTSPVGIFPEGNSTHGVSDLSGNVWEWCLDSYSTEEFSIGVDWVALHGGAYDSNEWDIVCSGHRGSKKEASKPNIGFRIVRRSQTNG